ncbi:hypothetical protein FRB90_000947 [Tulasnella sp. 427]|nr:hypothetical protein FRB90_000947 [Tulasnella sp. 427]
MPAIQPISSLPHCVSPAEHAEIISTTPQSFADIPPVLRHKQENVTVELVPAPEASEDNAGLEGTMVGTLYVIESVLAFILPSGKGFSVTYPRITLHAVSRSESTGPYVYCQLDETPEGVQVPEDEDAEMSELKIIPGDIESVEKIFEALSHCATLHPDPNGGGDAGLGDFEGFGDDDDDAFVDAEELDEDELSVVGRAALAHLESIIQPRRVDPSPSHDEVDEEESDKDVVEPTTANHGDGQPKANVGRCVRPSYIGSDMNSVGHNMLIKASALIRDSEEDFDEQSYARDVTGNLPVRIYRIVSDIEAMSVDEGTSRISRHQEFYYEDGNLCLLAGSVVLRLLKSQLARQSTVFADMFTVGGDQSALKLQGETYDGAPLVRVTESADDWTVVCRLLWNPPPEEQPPNFDAISSAIRISSKYFMTELRKCAIKWLEDFTSHGAEKSLNPTPTLDLYESHPGMAAKVVALAQECQIDSVLPFAMYHVAITSSSTLTQPVSLAYDDLVRILIGRDRLLAKWWTIVGGEKCFGFDERAGQCSTTIEIRGVKYRCGQLKPDLKELDSRFKMLEDGSRNPLAYLAKQGWNDESIIQPRRVDPPPSHDEVDEAEELDIDGVKPTTGSNRHGKPKANGIS